MLNKKTCSKLDIQKLHGKLLYFSQSCGSMLGFRHLLIHLQRSFGGAVPEKRRMDLEKVVAESRLGFSRGKYLADSARNDRFCTYPNSIINPKLLRIFSKENHVFWIEGRLWETGQERGKRLNQGIKERKNQSWGGHVGVNQGKPGGWVPFLQPSSFLFFVRDSYDVSTLI